MIGFLIGLAAGVVQFMLLIVYWIVKDKDKSASAVKSKSSSSSKKKIKASQTPKRKIKWLRVLLFMFTQFLFPFGVFIGAALFLDESMLWVCFGMIVSMIVCFIARFILIIRFKRAGNKK